MIQILEQFIQLCITNANAETRQKGRLAFLSWQTQSPHQAENFFKMLEYQVQRAILEDRD